MDFHPLILHEWFDDHSLSKRSLIWIHDNADPAEVYPVAAAIRELRAMEEP